MSCRGSWRRYERVLLTLLPQVCGAYGTRYDIVCYGELQMSDVVIRLESQLRLTQAKQRASRAINQ